jgi:hypothetical protein
LFIHMCIHCLGYFSPLPPTPSFSPLCPSFFKVYIDSPREFHLVTSDMYILCFFRRQILCTQCFGCDGHCCGLNVCAHSYVEL